MLILKEEVVAKTGKGVSEKGAFLLLILPR